MGIKEIFTYIKKEKAQENTNKAVEEAVDKTMTELKSTAALSPTSFFNYFGFPFGFSGEKNEGQAPPPEEQYPEYYLAALRSWILYLTDDFAFSTMEKTISQVIGAGLQFEAVPNNKALETLGYSAISDEQIKQIETMFRLSFNSALISDWKLEKSANLRAKNIMRNGYISGDCLVLLRPKNNRHVTVQVIDGAHVIATAESMENVPDNNTVEDGVEQNKRGIVVAYHVMTRGKAQRIKARTNGIEQAFLVKFGDFREDYRRGVSKFLTIMEKSAKLGRYSDSIVGGAEKIANTPMNVTHGEKSPGDNPFKNSIVGNFKGEATPTNSSYDLVAKGLNKVNISKENVALNMPVDAKLNYANLDFTKTYGEFSEPIKKELIAPFLIPFEVMTGSYTGSYSSSRAAINDALETVKEIRLQLTKQYHDKFYKYWLIYNTANGKLKIPQLMQAVANRDILAIEAITGTQWTGRKPAHIDPLKEVNALRIALGPEFANLPLITPQQAVELFGGTVDFKAMLNKMKTQKEDIDKIIPKPKEEENNNE